MDSMASMISSTACSNPSFPSLQMQFQPPPQLPPQTQHSSCFMGMDEEEDEELLKLAAEAVCGYSSFNFEENMVLDPRLLNTNSYQQQHLSNNCFLQYPECYRYLPFNHYHHMEDLQFPFQGELDSYIHYPDHQLLQTLEALNSPFHLEPPLPAETLSVDESAPLVRKSTLSVNTDSDRKRVTAQSLAARERRRNITRKTQELGKLIPGGTKMNTAEMLQSAFKYIQFLKSQLQLLQLMSSTLPLQGSEEMSAPPLHVVASPLIQEKLYMEGCCIIPRAFAKTLLQNITNHPSISEELRGII